MWAARSCSRSPATTIDGGKSALGGRPRWAGLLRALSHSTQTAIGRDPQVRGFSLKRQPEHPPYFPTAGGVERPVVEGAPPRISRFHARADIAGEAGASLRPSEVWAKELERMYQRDRDDRALEPVEEQDRHEQELVASPDPRVAERDRGGGSRWGALRTRRLTNWAREQSTDVSPLTSVSQIQPDKEITPCSSVCPFSRWSPAQRSLL
jgi:hypothetical protein